MRTISWCAMRCRVHAVLSRSAGEGHTPTHMKQTIFHGGVNDFCRTYFVGDRPLTSAEAAQCLIRGKEEQASIFEQFLLFDQISFKVYGENLVVPFLLRFLGQKGLESMIDQEAIGFTLWTPKVTYLVSDLPGIDPLQAGHVNSPAHSDPEESLELGFRWMKPTPDRGVRRHLTRKLRQLYRLPRHTLAQEAVALAHSALRSGKLHMIGFPKTENDIRNLNQQERRQLCDCATGLLEYAYLLESQMSSYSDLNFYSLFKNSTSRLSSCRRIAQNFTTIATLEGLPDLTALFNTMNEPFARLPKLRAHRNSIKFRDWLASASCTDRDIVKEYLSSLDAPQGFFETRTGKVTKSIVMTALGTGAGAAIAGAEGMVGGAVVGRLLEPAVDLGLDLVDEFLLAGLTKGWTPKLFFKDLEKLSELS